MAVAHVMRSVVGVGGALRLVLARCQSEPFDIEDSNVRIDACGRSIAAQTCGELQIVNTQASLGRFCAQSSRLRKGHLPCIWVHVYVRTLVDDSQIISTYRTMHHACDVWRGVFAWSARTTQSQAAF